MNQVLAFGASITGWGRKAYSCSPESHALAYAIVAMALMISIGGVYVWRRFIRTQPAENAV